MTVPAATDPDHVVRQGVTHAVGGASAPPHYSHVPGAAAESHLERESGGRPEGSGAAR
ncbi:hypothetical protein [Kitasatospora sp. NPDC057223]|uniref:hypothetical protein n=1 Tax=Kitasatospora sp. NPDC057223 TaxID=3346055 RepID=UPI00363E113D